MREKERERKNPIIRVDDIKFIMVMRERIPLKYVYGELIESKEREEKPIH